jgi:hypothetical protein
MRKLIFVAVLSVLSACGGGGGSSSTGSALNGISGFKGQAQKGPLLFGSEITVYELDQNLNQTGRSYDAQTTDDLGNFAIRAQVQTNIVKMVGVGYYMDELTGGLSAAPITLTAIADLTVDATPTINVLTTLATPRILSLMLGGTSYADATTQAQREVLAVFGIDATKINGLQALYAMSINGSNDQDAALLATSAVLSQMATNAALGGSSQAAQMSYFLSRIASDIANTGSLQTASIRNALNTASLQVNLATVRTNVQTYYANRGVTITAPKFEEWIDKSGSRNLPQRLTAATSFSFTNQTVETLVSASSNAVTVAGLRSGDFAQVALTATSTNSSNSTANNSNVRIVKNGSAVTGSYASVQNGDTLGIQLISDTIGSVITSTLTIGSTSASWDVTSRTPQVVYSKIGNCSAPQSASNKYFAIPFSLSSSSSINYVGVGIGAATAPNVVSIYSDNSGVPGTSLINTSTVSDGGYLANNPYPQAQLSATDQFTLDANTQYWIVLKYNSTSTPYMNNSCISLGNGYHRKMSSDGASWVDWVGTSGNTDDGNATNAPGFFLAN